MLDSPADRLPALLREATIVIEENARVAKGGLSAILWFNGEIQVQRAIRKSNEQIGAIAGVLLDEVKRDASTLFGMKNVPVVLPITNISVPVRLTRGPLDFGLPESKLPKSATTTSAPRYQLNGDVRFEIPNFIDGKRSISDIERALVGEFGSAAVEGFDKFIEDLIKVGVVKWK